MKEIKEFLELQKTIKQLFKNVSLSLLDKTYIIKNHSEILAKAERFYNVFKKNGIIPYKSDFHRSCSSCYMDNFLLLNSFTINQILSAMNKSFKLKEDALIYYEGKYYNDKSPNLTNEIAEIFFKKNPDIFESFDTNWKKKEITPEQVHEAITMESFDKYFEKSPLVPEPVKTIEPEPVQENVQENVQVALKKPIQKTTKRKTTKSKRK